MDEHGEHGLMGCPKQVSHSARPCFLLEHPADLPMVPLPLSTSPFLHQPLALRMCCNISPKLLLWQLQLRKCMEVSADSFSPSVFGKKEPRLLVGFREVLPPEKPSRLNTQAPVLIWVLGSRTSCKGGQDTMHRCAALCWVVRGCRFPPALNSAS